MKPLNWGNKGRARGQQETPDLGQQGKSKGTTREEQGDNRKPLNWDNKGRARGQQETPELGQQGKSKGTTGNP